MKVSSFAGSVVARIAILGPLAVLGIAGCGQPNEPHLQQVGGSSMGTTWALKWPGSEAVQPDLQKVVQALLDEREAEFSNWRDGSAVSRFNASESLEWQAMPAPVMRAVTVAKQVGEMTNGALDVTVGPLVALWGFGPAGRRNDPPSNDEVTAARERCGWHGLEIRPQPPALRKLRPDVELNLTAVTEGVVMDEIAGLLEDLGLTSFLFELGGEVVARGEPLPGRPWRVGVQSPGGERNETVDTLVLRDACLSTAGTYRQTQTLGNGEKISHIIDPRSGRPVEHRLISVSVLHSDCALADAYATALLVLGPEEGRTVAERLGLRVFWILKEE